MIYGQKLHTISQIRHATQETAVKVVDKKMFPHISTDVGHCRTMCWISAYTVCLKCRNILTRKYSQLDISESKFTPNY